MNCIKNLWIIALLTLVMVGCQKDQDITTDNTTEFSSIVEAASESAHTHAPNRRCGSKQHMEQRLQNADYKAAYDARKIDFQTYSRNNPSNSRAACSNPKILPVAVHYQGISNPNKACLISLAQSQIAVINQDFRGTNSDINQWRNTASAAFPGISNGEACFEFCLASKNHPSGFNLNNGDLAITFNQTNGDQINKWSGYINIIVNDADGDLGYAPLGGSGNGDGVVISNTAFGVGSGCSGVKPTAPFNLGRTLTHEMGHYLNLDHLWGDGGCNSDDLVTDTPGQTDANYDCPSIGATSCGSKDLHMSYMDYSNDACMYMFTAGQISRAENWVNSGLFNRLKTATTVCGTGGTTTGGTTTGGTTTGGTTTGGTTTGGGGTDVCATPTGLTAQATSTTFTASWAEGSDVRTYQLRYRKSGTTTWIRKNTTTNSQQITGLVSGTTYQYKVRTRCSDGKWTAYTSTKTVTLANAGGGNTGGGNTGGGTASTSTITMKVTLDDFGSETSFAIEKADGTVVKSWGPFADNRAGKVMTKNITLPRGAYIFVIYDDYGDGICCSEGAGKWQLLRDGSLIASSNGKFGYWEEQDFSVGSARVSDNGHRVDPKDFTKLSKKRKPVLRLEGE